MAENAIYDYTIELECTLAWISLFICLIICYQPEC